MNRIISDTVTAVCSTRFMLGEVTYPLLYLVDGRTVGTHRRA
jgi:hypothetical protein